MQPLRDIWLLITLLTPLQRAWLAALFFGTWAAWYLLLIPGILKVYEKLQMRARSM